MWGEHTMWGHRFYFSSTSWFLRWFLECVHNNFIVGHLIFWHQIKHLDVNLWQLKKTTNFGRKRKRICSEVKHNSAEALYWKWICESDSPPPVSSVQLDCTGKAVFVWIWICLICKILSFQLIWSKEHSFVDIRRMQMCSCVVIEAEQRATGNRIAKLARRGLCQKRGFCEVFPG